MFKLGRLPVFSHKWGMKPDGSHTPFDQIVNEIPIGSGPYTIARMDSGRRIEFKRNPDYWARDLPVRRGLYNFDRIVYRYYQDEDIAIEAFKAGEFDIVRRSTARDLGAPARGPEVRRRPDRQGRRSTSAPARACRPTSSTCAGRSSRTSACARRSVLTYDFETQQPLPDFGLKRANSVFNNSEFAAAGAAVAGRAEAARAVPRPAAEGGVRAALRRAAHRRRPERAAPQPAEGARAARGRRLEARRRRRAAQCQGRALRRRVLAPSSQDTDRRMLPLGAQRRQARHDDPRAPRRLRALQPAPRGVRLRHGDDRRAAHSSCPRWPTTCRCTAARRPTRRAATTSAA